MIKKTNTHKIELQSNNKIFVWDCDNLLESKLKKKNYENKFQINQKLKNAIEIKKSKKKSIKKMEDGV
jgi:hypothetical protein